MTNIVNYILYKYSYESVDTIEKIIKSIFYNNFENKENF